MFLPERMHKVYLTLLDSDAEKVLSEIQRKSLAQVEEIHKFIKDLKPGEPLEMYKEFSELEIGLSRLLETFHRYVPRGPGGIKALIKPPKVEKIKVKRRDPKEILKEAGKLFSEVSERLSSLDNKIKSLRDQIEEFKAVISTLEKVPFKDVRAEFLGEGPFAFSSIYLVSSENALKEALDRVGGYGIFERVELKKKTYQTYSLVILDSEKYEEFVELLPPGSVTPIAVPNEEKGTISEVIDSLRERIEERKKEIEECKREIRELYSKYERKLKEMLDEVHAERVKREAGARSGRTLYTRTFCFWVPDSRREEFIQTVIKASEGRAVLHLEEAREEEDPPIKLNNPRWARPFEMLTRLFALPKYGKVDPTVIIGPLFVIFYGMMLGDFMYGFLAFLGGLIVTFGIGKVYRGYRDFGIVITCAGFTSMVVGAIQGGYFGDTMPKFFSFIPPHIYDPLKNPMPLLKLALLIGIFQLNLGMAISSYQLLREKNYKEFVQDRLSWFIIQPCGAILLLDYLFGKHFSPIVLKLCLVGVAIGVLLLFWKHKGLGFFEITGFLGEWLSYTRILALDLATSGTAMTVNIVVGIVLGLSRYLVPLAAIVWLFGHIINSALQNLGSFVHSLRLQYVEFFGKFYESGGREYVPLSEGRKFTIPEEVVS